MRSFNSLPASAPRPHAEQLLADFQRVRKDNTPLPDVVRQTLTQTLGAGVAEMSLDMPLGQALMRLAQAVQDDTDSQPDQLNYHNVAHFREAVMSVGHLCALEFEGQMACPHFVVLAMTAMVGHDFKHDGTSNTPSKSLEAMAWAACKPHMEGVHSEDMRAIESIILGTDPTLLNEHRARYAHVEVAPATIDRLRLLACEADLTPSLLPAHGVAMGKLYAAELSASGVPHLESLGKTISTWESRMGFLRHATPISVASEKFGLVHMHQAQGQAFSALTETLGLINDKEAARYLDSLETNLGSVHASQLYLAALSHVDPSLGRAVSTAMGLPHPSALQRRLSFGM